MNNPNKRMLLNQSIISVSKLTNDLNKELGKIQVSSSQEENKIIFDICDGILANLNEEISKLKKFN